MAEVNLLGVLYSIPQRERERERGWRQKKRQWHAIKMDGFYGCCLWMWDVYVLSADALLLEVKFREGGAR